MKSEKRNALTSFEEHHDLLQNRSVVLDKWVQIIGSTEIPKLILFQGTVENSSFFVL